MSVKTAVIYARFSCSKQREASIADQVRVCSDWCAREGYEIVATYRDEAVSGRTDNRPAFQEMIANAGESDIVLVYMMDRFSRDIYDAPIYKKMLRDKGVRVMSATETLPDGPESMLMESMYEAMAAMESAKIGIRSKRGMEGNALACLYNGDRVFGYAVDPETKRYVIDDYQADIVRECFNLRAQGESVNSIARIMAAKGVKTYRGKPCSHTMVQNLLRNVRYKGVYKWGDIEVDGGMPAIVTLEEWDMAQNANQAKRRKLEQWDEYAFTGKAVCGGCAHNMVGTSGRGKNNVKYTYYTCGNKCGKVKNVPRDWLENHVAEALREFVSDRETALVIGRRLEEYQAECNPNRDRQRAQAAIREADKSLANILNAIEQGIIAPGIQERIDELQAEKDRAQRILDTTHDYTLTAESFADFLQFASTLTDEKLIDMLVWQIVVKNEEIIVALNYDVEPNVPQRFTIDGFAQISKWSDENEKKAEHQGEKVFDRYLNGSPFTLLCETRNGMSLAVNNGRIAIIMRRAA